MKAVYPILRLVKHFVLFVFDQVFFLTVKNKNNKDNRILIVRLDAIGDFVLWLDAAKAIRELYPKTHYNTTLLGNQSWMDLANHINIWDQVWGIDVKQFERNLSYRWKVLSKLRDGNFGTVIHPTYSKSHDADVAVRASGADRRIGFDGDLSNMTVQHKKLGDSWYTQLIPSSSKPLMELLRNAEFVRNLGSFNFQADVPLLHSNTDIPKTLPSESFYLLFPGAGWRGRQWPPAYFAELACKIYWETGWLGIVCGGRSIAELKSCEQVIDKASQISPVPLVNEAGKTTLLQFISIIAHAQFVVSNETSAIHIAAAVNTPSVCILGGGHYGRFVPYKLEKKTARPLPIVVSEEMECFGCNWICQFAVKPEEAVPCIQNISVQAVWNKVLTLIRTSLNDANPKNHIQNPNNIPLQTELSEERNN